MDTGENNVGYKTGKLPESAPLGASYIPFQQNNPPTYDNEEGLTRGTLFPGLDLPYKNNVNKANPEQGTALGELMALDFALGELALYMDTHEDDQEVFELYQKCVSEAKEARKKYVMNYGPVEQTESKDAKKYTWLKNPWPWDYTERMD